ncbi:EAL domain-containing protein [Devosia sp. XJ19-1]|uniref:EAL domain-containing protein n=1 Tax=Devosia ureilytica TaxID=2952754 RepID=A0A9Q4AR11_9HYPH|nr:EAL domain-containing protein [Devosia ureilytica]MCP8885427.1 EAL domain-containing protein [Devosia ureilytica]MCP8888106.1 EAL domain-containing protein [Devosia ureilytica]
MKKKAELPTAHNRSSRRREPETKAADKWGAFLRAPTLLSLVIENIPAMVAVKEANELRFVLFNRTAEELIGVSRHAALGKSDFDLFPKGEAEFFIARDRDVLASGQPLTIPEEQITTSQRGVRILRTTKMPVFDATGRPQYLLAMSEDITEHKRAEAALMASERRWAFALESAGQGVWEADILNNTVYYSPTWKRMRGIDVNEDVDSSLEAWLSRVHPEDREHIRQTIAKQNSGELSRNAFEYREWHREGRYIWISSNGAPDAWDAEGRPIRMIGLDTDITQRKEQEQNLRDVTQRLEIALRASCVGVFEGNLETGELLWDDRVREIFGRSADRSALTSSDWERALDPEDASETLAALSEAKTSQKTFRHRYRIIRPDGCTRTIAADAEFFRHADGSQRFIGTNTDITEEVELQNSLLRANELAEARNAELEAARARLEKQSLHDALTGLPNRRYLDEILEDLAKRRQENNIQGLSILHIDLDRFKQINDTLGHSAGDAVLQRVARILLDTSGLGAFVARVGGDEFVIVCPNQTDAQKLSKLADQVIHAIQRPIPYEGHSCRIGASIGVAVEAGALIDPRRVLINGDMALYHAKERGRNRHEFFSKSIQEELESTKRIADEILQAIERCEFVPYYQPVVDAQTFEPVGVEALVRWRHPSGELLTPNRFLRIAQDLNVLAAIDGLILSQAISDLDEWQVAGLPIQSVSTNVSFGRLSDENLVPSLRKLNIKPGTVSFEFLESIFLDEFEDRVAWNIDAIKEMGIGIDVDDFGTGHTSFVSLLRLMPRRFKIDRQLVSPVASSDAQRQLVGSIVDIGRTLGIKVVAEGVETVEQASVLREIGCDFLQGYAFGKPMPAAKLVEWLRSAAWRLAAG